MGRGWQVIARIILKARIPILVVTILATIFMWFNRSTERSHNFGKIVPENDPEFVFYEAFKKEFGDDGNVLIIGIEGDFFQKEYFNTLFALTEALKEVDAVTDVVSLANVSAITANLDAERFALRRVVDRPVKTEAEMDSVRKLITGLPFYRGLLVDNDYKSSVIAVSLDAKRLDTSEKTRIVGDCISTADEYLGKIGVTPHYAGLPHIRAFVTDFIPKEMVTFLVLAILVMALFLYITFRSFYAVMIPLVVIGVVIIWALGMMGLLGYKITVLTAVLPSLIAVIGVPNSIYLITKYHFEYKRTLNKVKSLVLVIQKIGIVTVMTNATTAVGFGVLAFTKIQVLKEFGILAGLSVMVTFFISLVLIPIFFSFLPAPNHGQIRHTERKLLGKAITFLENAAKRYRWAVYAMSILFTGLAFLGMYLVEPRSYMTDDLPRNDKIIDDLDFLEDRFNGVLPFEIVVNTHRKQGILRHRTLKNLDDFQQRMTRFDDISRSLSLLDLVKFGRQALLSGVPSEYQLPSREEFTAIGEFARNSKLDSLVGQATIFDQDYQKARIKANIKDIGASRMGVIIDSLNRDLTEIFVRNTRSGRLKEGTNYKLFGEPDFKVRYAGNEYENGASFVATADTAYEVLAGEGKIDFEDRYHITGTTMIYVKSNEFLIRNLVQSLIIAFLVIAVLMALLFGSLKMVITALLPNLLPLLLTGGIMGYFGIPLKPSTALIFSVAFGIAVDDTIHYLARYRLARKTGDGIVDAVSNSFKDTGVSMIYTSIILFFGFVIFAFSSYGGTKALGQLTSLTLLVALFTNLLLLPSLLISLNKDDDEVPTGYIEYDEEEDYDEEAIVS